MTVVVNPLESRTQTLKQENPLKLSAYGPRSFEHERIPPLLMPKDIVRIETIWMCPCQGVLAR